MIKFATVGAAIVLLGCAALLGFAALVVAPRLTAPIASSASEALGRAVHLASVSVVVLPFPTLRLKGLEIAEDADFGTTPFLTLEQADVRLRLRPLLHRQLEIDSILLEQLHLRIIRDAAGRVNVANIGSVQQANPQTPPSDSGETAMAPALLGTRVQIDGGVVSYISQGADDATSEYELDDIALTLAAGPRVTFEGKGLLQPGDIRVDVTDGSVTLDGVSRLGDAPVRARLMLGARNITDLAAGVLGPAPAIDGGVKAALVVAGTLTKPTASGDVEMPGIAFTRTSPQCPEPQWRTLMLRALKVSAAWEGDRLVGRPAMTEIGNGTITANLVLTFSPSVRLELGDVAITALPLEKILVDFFCEGYAVTGPLDLTGALSLDSGGAAHTLSSFGQLRIGPGQVVGPQALALLSGIVRVGGAFSALLSADLPWSLFSSPLDFDSITATYQIANGVLSIRDFRYVSGAMKIAGTGDYELASERLDLDLIVNHGRGEAYAKVTGTADSPSIHVTPSTILRDVDPGKIGHGLQDLFHRLF